MEALEMLKTLKRICSKYKCSDCPVVAKSCICIKNISITSDETLLHIIENVEQWSKENPLVTNAQKFVEVFGKHNMSDLTICEIRPISHEIIPKKSNWWNEPYEEPDHDT